MPVKLGRTAKGFEYRYTIGANAAKQVANDEGAQHLRELAEAYEADETCSVLIKACSEKQRRRYIEVGATSIFTAAELAWQENVTLLPGEFVDMDGKPVSKMSDVLAQVASDFLIDVYNEIREPLCHSDPNS